MPSGEEFFRRARRFAQKYFVYFKANQHGAAEKARRLGVLAIFKQAPAYTFKILS